MFIFGQKEQKLVGGIWSLFVQYAPSVTVTPVRDRMIDECDKGIGLDGRWARVDKVRL